MKKALGLAALLLAALFVMSQFASEPIPAGSGQASGDLIRTVSNGETVELGDLLEEGEWTVVQFTAPWCPGCRQLEPKLQAAIQERGDIRLRTINIRDWGSPVARQHGIERIPQLWLHDGTKRVSTDTRDVTRRLEQ